MIRVYLYGDLRRFGAQQRPDRDTVVTLVSQDQMTVGKALAQIGIREDEVAHVFLNAKLLKAGSSMAPWLGYQVDREWDRPGRDYLDTLIASGDRLGIFPRRMGLLVV